MEISLCKEESKAVSTVNSQSPSTISHRAIGSRTGFLGPMGPRSIVNYVLLCLHMFLEIPTLDTSHEWWPIRNGHVEVL